MVSGKTDFFIYAITAISIVAATTDLLRGRIYNWLTFPGLIVGVVFSTINGGWYGLTGAFFGITLALFLYGWMFWIGVMGAGDVKLLMALGAWGGLKYTLQVGLLGIMLGGAIALVILVFSRKITDFIKRLYHFILTLFIKELEIEFPKINHQMKMPFGLAIAIAAVLVAFTDPFVKLGLW